MADGAIGVTPEALAQAADELRRAAQEGVALRGNFSRASMAVGACDPACAGAYQQMQDALARSLEMLPGRSRAVRAEDRPGRAGLHRDGAVDSRGLRGRRSVTALDLPLLPEVEIPPGDPEALRAAARTYQGVSEQTRQVGTWVRRTVHGTVGSQWSGAASTAFLGEGDRIAGGHDGGTRVLEEGGSAIIQYADRLEQAQQMARRAQQAAEDYNREATQLRTQQQATADPAAQAHINGLAEQLAPNANQVLAMSSQASTAAGQAAQQAAAAFGAVAQGAAGIASPVAATVLAPKGFADSLMGLRKELGALPRLSRWSGAAGSTEEALARWLGLGGKLGRFAPAVKWIGKRAPAVGVGFGLYDMAFGESAEQRALGGVSAAGSGMLAASAMGAFAAGTLAATAVPVVGAAVLTGVAAYQLYKHREEIAAGASKAWSATRSGVTKAANWTGDKLGDAKDWAADRAGDAAGAVKKGVGNAAEGFAHGVSKGAGAVAHAFGF